MALPAFCDETDSWENAYFHFVECLRTVASPPAEAAKTYGHFNVAGELWLEVRGGPSLARCEKHRLSPQHIRLIEELATAVELLPDDASHYTEKKHESLRQLEHPAWQTPRTLAAHLLAALEPITESNRAYIYSGKSV
jgi:hypothetical protein